MTRARGRYFNDDRFGRWGMNDGRGGHMPLRFVTMDHGGNSFIVRRLPGLPIYAPPLEAAIIAHPLLEPLYLYGALPPRELQSKFLLAPSSPAQPLPAAVTAWR